MGLILLHKSSMGGIAKTARKLVRVLVVGLVTAGSRTGKGAIGEFGR
ncbi:MAG: hypothetical protein GDA56_11525 [Hormoscilla sp. GM7CHS1pb]|nr:hypothetical protein [Hormoscilla sp. GM7CHS1pb]